MVTHIYEKHMNGYSNGIQYTPLKFAGHWWRSLLFKLDEYFGHSYVTKLEENLWDAFDRFCFGDSDRYGVIRPISEQFR